MLYNPYSLHVFFLVSLQFVFKTDNNNVFFLSFNFFYNFKNSSKILFFILPSTITGTQTRKLTFHVMHFLALYLYIIYIYSLRSMCELRAWQFCEGHVQSRVALFCCLHDTFLYRRSLLYIWYMKLPLATSHTLDAFRSFKHF